GGSMKWRASLLALYPAAWRERYGEEFAALLEQGLHSPLDVVDVLLGALDAHLALSPESNWRKIEMSNKLRTAILLVFTAYIGFVIAGLGVYGFADDSPFISMMSSNAGLLISWRMIQLGAVVGLVSVVVGGAPLAWMLIGRGLTSQRESLRWLLVPIASFVVFAAYLGVMVYLSQGNTLPPASASPMGLRLLWGLVGVFILGAILSTFAVWKIVTATDTEKTGAVPRISPFEYAVTPAIIATLAMAAMFVASAAWFWFAFSARPDILLGNQGPLMMSSKLGLAGTLLLMAAALGVAVSGLTRLRRAR
ncbi:MAG TPA: hypothetical protein VIU38_03060, partial [Anaerolineales bacterium]